MPEGPEVLTIVNSLNKFLAGKILTNIESLIPKYNFLQELPFPLKIVNVKCKGKQIYFTLDEIFYLTNHLMMTGGWSTNPEIKYKCVIFKYIDDEGDKKEKEIYYTDVRKFGKFQFTKNIKEILDTLADGFIGENLITLITFKNNFKQRKRKGLITAILDQSSICSGIGNYLIAEILFAARIYPFQKCGDLSNEEIEKLYEKTKEIITASYNSGGTTIKDYYTLDGKAGEYSKKLLVYNKKNVIVDGKTYNVVGEMKNQRTMWYVPELQIYNKFV